MGTSLLGLPALSFSTSLSLASCKLLELGERASLHGAEKVIIISGEPSDAYMSLIIVAWDQLSKVGQQLTGCKSAGSFEVLWCANCRIKLESIT